MLFTRNEQKYKQTHSVKGPKGVVWGSDQSTNEKVVNVSKCYKKGFIEEVEEYLEIQLGFPTVGSKSAVLLTDGRPLVEVYFLGLYLG